MPTLFTAVKERTTAPLEGSSTGEGVVREVWLGGRMVGGRRYESLDDTK